MNQGRAKYSAKIVRAVVSSDPSQLPGADRLQLMSWTGIPYPEPWAIKIIEELDDTGAGLPHGETIRAEKRS